MSVIHHDYVPRCIPGEFGDYLEFDIDADGRVAKWGQFCTPERVAKSFWSDNG